MVINFWDFSGATSLLKGLHLSFFGFLNSFDGFSFFIYIFPMYKKSKLFIILWEAKLIQGAIFIIYCFCKMFQGVGLFKRVFHKVHWQVFGFFDHLPPSLTSLPYKSWHFLTTYPPPLVNVVYERPQRAMSISDSRV